MRHGTAQLFVYGTLTEPRRLTRLVGSAWRVHGRAMMRGVLYDLGAYPGFRPSADEQERVPGVVVELMEPKTALALLDDYEGVPAGLYVRRRCRARLTDGRVRVPWVYVYDRPTPGMPRVAGWSAAAGGGAAAGGIEPW